MDANDQKVRAGTLKEIVQKLGYLLGVCVGGRGSMGGSGNSSTFILKRKNADFDCVPLEAKTELISFI